MEIRSFERLVLLFFFFASHENFAQQSTFDANDEGWTTVNAAGSPTPLYSSTGGNPGGKIRAVDPFASASVVYAYFIAPSKFLGNRCASYGRNLRFDIQQSQARSYVDQPNVILSNGTVTLEYRPTAQVYPAVEPAWSSYAIPLIEGSEWINASTGAIATQAEMQNVLCNLTTLMIRARYGSSSEGVGGLDNVLLETSAIVFTAQPSPVILCEGANTSFSVTAGGDTNLQYQWQIDNGGFTNLVNDAVYAGVNSNTLTITGASLALNGSVYRVLVRGDVTSNTPSSSATLTVNARPAAPGVTNASGCSPAILTLNASGSTNGNYRWYAVPTGGTALTGEINSSFTTPALTASTSYYAVITDGTCESARATVTATVYSPPAQPVVTSSIPPSGNTVSICKSNVTLSAPSGFNSYLWSNAATTQQITVSQPGAYTVRVTDANGCMSISSVAINVVEVSSLCNVAPVILEDTVIAQVQGNVNLNLLQLINDPDNNLDFSTLKIVSQPVSGATAQIVNNFLIINYTTIKFSGMDQVTIEICDLAASCTQEQIRIQVVGDITVYNAVAPNGHEENRFLFLEYIDVFESTKKNRVTIFNRWGDVVYEARDYDNVNVRFEGLNKSGNELPSGTYFYRIEFLGTPKRGNKTGYISLKR